MSDSPVEAVELEKFVDRLPSSYAFFDESGELVMIGPDHPQYLEAKARFESRLRRIW